MLGVKQYSKEYIDSCRKKVQIDTDAFRKIKPVSETHEIIFFNNIVLLLDYMFVHRMRGRRGKDGNPLNEVRMICTSILTNNNKLLADNTIKYNDAKCVLKIKIGENIEIKESGFIKIYKAFFAEIEKKFTN